MIELRVTAEEDVVEFRLNSLSIDFRWARPRWRWEVKRHAWDIHAKSWTVMTPLTVGTVRWWG